MSTTAVCDGCGTSVDAARTAQVGRDVTCLYCPTCQGKWDEFVQAARVRREQLTEEYDAWRDAELQILAAHHLKKTPAPLPSLSDR